jgi:hypothetical protein
MAVMMYATRMRLAAPTAVKAEYVALPTARKGGEVNNVHAGIKPTIPEVLQ